MRRLYLQIYLGFLAILVAVTLVAGALFRLAGPGMLGQERQAQGFVRLLARDLPPADAPAAEQDAALDRLARELGVHATLWGPGHELLGNHGRDLPPPPRRAQGRLTYRSLRSPALGFALGDGRWLTLSQPHEHRGAPYGLLALLAFAGLLAIGAWPLSRRIAGRLERLRAGVEAFGTGDLAARAPVEGRDEVADVARSFNRAAERVETLVAAQRRVLASASHELRSPLARLRLAVDLMGEQVGEKLRREAESDIEELDELIEDLLLTGRLDARSELGDVDLSSLAERECARAGAALEAAAVTITGDARALRRMLRNLLENARRHAGDAQVVVQLERLPDAARIRVLDRGPGVPESERVRIFEPFYRPANHDEGRDGGVGLGLALVREIARAHGGEAACRPREGGGSIFEVTLAAGVAPEPS
jgi:signal transduction histidine kinase